MKPPLCIIFQLLFGLFDKLNACELRQPLNTQTSLSYVMLHSVVAENIMTRSVRVPVML